MTTRVVLWRHGITDYNAAGRFQGHADIPMNDQGRRQAARAAARLATHSLDALYSSPLERAYETAQALAAVTGLEIFIDPRLKEIHVGQWEGRTTEDVSAEFPDFAHAIANDRDIRRSPTGETAMETGERVGEAVRSLALRHRGQTIVVATHGLAIRMAAAHLMGWDYPTAVRLAGMSNCGWTLMEFDGHKWRMRRWNQVA